MPTSYNLWEMENNKLDRLFRDKLESRNFELSKDQWISAKKLLQENPKRDRSMILFWLFSGTALILFLGFGFRSYRITGLYEKHKNAYDVSGLYWYYGVGAHLAYWNFPGCNTWKWNGYKWLIVSGPNCVNSGVGFGVDGILGMEYLIPDLPITVAIDVKPYIEFSTVGTGYFPIVFWDLGMVIRYVF